jgi:hypothetical protein
MSSPARSPKHALCFGGFSHRPTTLNISFCPWGPGWTLANLDPRGGKRFPFKYLARSSQLVDRAAARPRTARRSIQPEQLWATLAYGPGRPTALCIFPCWVVRISWCLLSCSYTGWLEFPEFVSVLREARRTSLPHISFAPNHIRQSFIHSYMLRVCLQRTCAYATSLARRVQNTTSNIYTVESVSAFQLE